MTQSEPLDFLVIAPHPDDAELGMGGTIIKMVEAGLRVGILDLTSGEPTPHGSEALRAAETAAATEIRPVPATDYPRLRGAAALVLAPAYAVRGVA